MSTKLLNKDLEEIKSSFDSIFSFENYEDQIELDASIIMARFLSEIQKLTEERGISRKELASMINSSPSYLTQVFRNNKPLNFLTIAKIQNALGITFDITVKEQVKNKVEISESEIAEYLDRWFIDNNNGVYFKIIRNFSRDTEKDEKDHHNYIPPKKPQFIVA